jgi:LytS/YehU family sensor histidine kinase
LILFILEGKNFLGLGFHSITDILTRQFFSVGSILFFSYWGIVVLLGLKKYYEEIEEAHRKSIDMQTQLEEVTLSSLQAQLKPHFLFNTLSMVDQMMTENPKNAIDIVDKLERLLRNTFDQQNAESCTVKEEINFLKKYLSIEESRFQDRLEVNYSTEKATEEVKIPRYLLQPLVENALKHGVSKSMETCTILIKSEFVDENLALSVENDGYQSRNHKKINNKGIGLKNVEERIALYFGKEANLIIEYTDSGKFISKILIPEHDLKSAFSTS